MAAAQPVNSEEPDTQPAKAGAAPELTRVKNSAPQSDEQGKSIADGDANAKVNAKTDGHALAEGKVKTDANANAKANVTAETNEIAKSEAKPDLNAEASDEATVSELEKNPTKRVVDEVVVLMGEIHETKEEIIARGIPFHTANVLVELGLHGKLEEQASMRKTALETSKKQYGGAAITPEKLDAHLETLVNLEKDLGHVRRLGREQGLDMNSVNYLTLIIRQNPGDGGEKMINTFLAYAMACDIPLHRIEEFLEEATSGPKSVLPDIPRDDTPDIAAAARKRLITDIFVGCALALMALTLLT